jgi:hypothetical protein
MRVTVSDTAIPITEPRGLTRREDAPAGLMAGEARRRLAEFGPNAVSEKTPPRWHVFAKFWGPMPWLLEAAFLIQLALGSRDFGKSKEDRFVSPVTAGCAVWNIGLAFIVGVTTYYMLKHRWVKL